MTSRIALYLLPLSLLVCSMSVYAEEDLTLCEQMEIYTATRSWCGTGFSWAQRYINLRNYGLQPDLFAQRILDDPSYDDYWGVALNLQTADRYLNHNRDYKPILHKIHDFIHDKELNTTVCGIETNISCLHLLSSLIAPRVSERPELQVQLIETYFDLFGSANPTLDTYWLQKLNDKNNHVKQIDPELKERLIRCLTNASAYVVANLYYLTSDPRFYRMLTQPEVNEDKFTLQSWVLEPIYKESWDAEQFYLFYNYEELQRYRAQRKMGIFD